MIAVTRLSGEVVIINSDLVERIEATPDSVITLTNGSRYVVRESVVIVVEKVREWRSEIMRGVFVPSPDAPIHPHLHLIEHPGRES